MSVPYLPPSTHPHRYAHGCDVALVVRREVLRPLAEAWDQMERSLMVREH